MVSTTMPHFDLKQCIPTSMAIGQSAEYRHAKYSGPGGYVIEDPPRKSTLAWARLVHQHINTTEHTVTLTLELARDWSDFGVTVDCTDGKTQRFQARVPRGTRRTFVMPIKTTPPSSWEFESFRSDGSLAAHKKMQKKMGDCLEDSDSKSWKGQDKIIPTEECGRAREAHEATLDARRVAALWSSSYIRSAVPVWQLDLHRAVQWSDYLRGIRHAPTLITELTDIVLSYLTDL